MWMYREADGALIGYVCRFIASDGGKDDIPLCFARHSKSGSLIWNPRSIEKNNSAPYDREQGECDVINFQI
jgi:hypothetical protein